jgi:hypothetical protein
VQDNNAAGGSSISYQTVATNVFNINNSYPVLIYQTDNSNYQYATVKSWDADGFTLSWVKQSSPAGTATLTFLCFR